MNTVYVGSGGFSGDLLHDLLQAGCELSGVITRPDQPAGRGLHPRPTPVKETATGAGLLVFQPAGPGDPLFAAALGELQAEVIVVADYGYLLPRSVLEYTPNGCLNVHPSLLPRFRGAAPIQRALMEGEKLTGVTLMLLDEGMDSGGIIAREQLVVEDADDALSLRGKLASLGARLLIDTLPRYLSGTVAAVPQDEAMATYADPIRKTDTVIDWGMPAESIHNQVRALSPRPGAHASFRGKRMRVLRSRVRDDIRDVAPGKLLLPGKDEVLVGTGVGALQLLEVQLEGKKAVSAGEFRRGYRPADGDDLSLPSGQQGNLSQPR